MRPVLRGWVLALVVAIVVMGGLFWVRGHPAKPYNPLEESVATISEVLGIQVSVNPDSRGGELIEKVRPGGPAERMGVRAGERIVAVGERSVWHAQQLQQLIAQRSQMGMPIGLMLASQDNTFRVVAFGPVAMPPPRSPDEHGDG
jgi:predicted metalloprotease with PDZ domain